MQQFNNHSIAQMEYQTMQKVRNAICSCLRYFYPQKQERNATTEEPKVA